MKQTTSPASVETPTSPIVVVLGTDDNYLIGAIVTMQSIVTFGARRTNWLFRILDFGISPDNKEKFEAFAAHNVNTEIAFHSPDLTVIEQTKAKPFLGNYTAYTRLLLSEIIPEKKCIYVDTDILVIKDLAELWKMDLADYAMAACLNTSRYDTKECNKLSSDCAFDTSEDIKNSPYYNSGLAILNLERWRYLHAKEGFIELLKKHGDMMFYADQTALNYLFRGKIATLPPEWNTIPWWTKPIRADQNLHYTSKDKPWNTRLYLPAEQFWLMFYKIKVAPHWDLRRKTARPLYGVYRFLRVYVLPSLFLSLYFRLARMVNRKQKTSQILEIQHLKTPTYRQIRHWLFFGNDRRTREALQNYKKILLGE